MVETNTEGMKTQEEVDFDSLLDDFLNSELSGIEDYRPSEQALQAENKKQEEQVQLAEEKETPSFTSSADLDGLGSGERELMKAYSNFIESVYTISEVRQVEPPAFMLQSYMLIPNYRPLIGKTLSKDVLDGWDFLLNACYEELKDLNTQGTDDEFLNFAERLSDPNLQFAIVSYIEILIELESCEISYEEKKIKARKRKIEKQIIEEQKRKNERKKRFIEAVAAKNFPIDSERLINNYIKTASKDPKGAFEALTENPAIYAPIQIDKIKPRLFGLIKKGPKDGIRMNKKIGKFLRRLKA